MQTEQFKVVDPSPLSAASRKRKKRRRKLGNLKGEATKSFLSYNLLKSLEHMVQLCVVPHLSPVGVWWEGTR